MQIKPLRENERSIENWISFLRNLSSLKSIIYLFISGNNTHIALYLSCPTADVQFIENMFYANYPDSELIITTTTLDKANEYIHYTPKTTLRTHQEYTNSGNYISPFHDLISIFNTVDIHTTLTIQIGLQFQQQASIFEKIW
jgi:hypothetical protein